MGCLIFINKLLFHFQKKEVKGKKKKDHATQPMAPATTSCRLKSGTCHTLSKLAPCIDA
jgi:hypothetical protein